VPTGRAHLRIAGTLPNDVAVAVAAVARPDLFLAQLLQGGANVSTMLAYPDHHAYTPADAAHIAARAANHLLLTTEKDAVKLRDLMPEQPLQVIGQELVFESGAGDLMRAVDNVL
jgi:tetraacyldisaccharide 4'-kinase